MVPINKVNTKKHIQETSNRKNNFGLSTPVIKVLCNHPKEHTGGAEIAAPTILKWQGGYF